MNDSNCAGITEQNTWRTYCLTTLPYGNASEQCNAVKWIKNQLVEVKKCSPVRDYEQNINFIINKRKYFYYAVQQGLQIDLLLLNTLFL